jgi:hypothetical protein
MSEVILPREVRHRLAVLQHADEVSGASGRGAWLTGLLSAVVLRA